MPIDNEMDFDISKKWREKNEKKGNENASVKVHTKI